MKINLLLKAATVVFLFSVVARAQEPAQEQSGTAQPAASSQDEGALPAVADEQGASAPAFMTGQSLAFSSELGRSNYVRAGISVGASYDDNALNTPTNPISDFSYYVMPHIELEQARERVKWLLGYSGGFTANQRLSSRNQGSHEAVGSLIYRLSPHADVHVSERFSLTTNFFDQFQSGTNPVTGPVNQPNTTAITPLAKRMDNVTSADVKWQFGAGDMVGGGGTYGDLRFRDVPVGSTSLIDTQVYSGNLFYSHRLTERNWSGIAYQFQRLNFQPIFGGTSTHGVFLFDTIYIQPRMTLSLFVGPQYSEVDSQSVQPIVTVPVVSLAIVNSTQKTWSVSGGATFGWQGEHNSIRISAVRRVADGGGLLGSVLFNTVDGAYRRQLAPWTAVSLGAVYGNNRALGSALTDTRSYNSASGNAGLEQRLPGNLKFFLGYAREYQKTNTLAASADVNHNRVWVGVSYDFQRPLGR